MNQKHLESNLANDENVPLHGSIDKILHKRSGLLAFSLTMVKEKWGHPTLSSLYEVIPY